MIKTRHLKPRRADAMILIASGSHLTYPCCMIAEDRYTRIAGPVPKWRALPSAVRLITSLSRYTLPVGDHDLTVLSLWFDCTCRFLVGVSWE